MLRFVADTAAAADRQASRTATQVTSAVYDFGAGAITEPGLYVFLTLVVVLATWLAARRRPTVYLVDFETYVPPDDLQVTMETFLRRTKETGLFSQESIDFQEKILRSSTLCEQTYFPPGIMKDPMRLNLDAAREEAIMVMGGAVEQVLEKTGTRARDIDVVVVNCSLFCPTPSLASILVNKFKMRSDVLHYSLGGMGCSAGLISIDLVERIMHSRPGTTALVVSTENITLNWYRGDQKSMLISNCLFRVGAAAVLLSNKRRDARRAKFKLKHLVRTHMGANDDAFHSVYQVEDDKKVVGVSLSKKIMQVAGDALRSNMTRLGPLVLPFSEQLPFVFNLISRKVLQRSFPIPRVARTLLHRWLQLSLATPGVGHVVRACSRLPADAGQPKDGGEGVITGAPYVPDFKKAFDFFCIHAGGRAVLDAIEKNLQLTEHDMMPSRATLRRFGNTSSSSVWYELDFIRKEFGVKRGQKVWQIAFGSGFLCNSAVWEALRPVHD